MPWNNQAVDLIILTEETTGFSGLFAYSPIRGAGNLVLSIAAAAGTDPYGNAYRDGVTVYNSGAGLYTQIVKGNGVYLGESGYSDFEPGQLALTGAQFNSYGAAVLYSPIETSSDTRAWIAAESGTTGGQGPAILLNGKAVCPDGAYAVDPANGAALESWHSLPIPSGWTAHGSTAARSFRYKLMPFNMVAFAMDLTAPATAPADGTVIGTIPSSPVGYLPVTPGHFPLATSVSPAAGAQGPHVDVGTSGQIKCYGIGGGAVVSCSGFYPLD